MQLNNLQEFVVNHAACFAPTKKNLQDHHAARSVRRMSDCLEVRYFRRHTPHPTDPDNSSSVKQDAQNCQLI